MDFKYKIFNIDGFIYIFCIEDFEVIKIHQKENIENALQDLRIKKERTKSNKNIFVDNINLELEKTNLIEAIGIEVVNGCNLNCTYCFISASKKEKKLLSDEKFISILSFIKKNKYNPNVLYFTGGGEPTLNFKLLKNIPNLCKQHGFDNIKFDLTTNGTIITNNMIEFLKQNDVTLNISLDGNEKINDTSRVYRDGKGSFKDVFNTIKILKDNKIEFSCKTVIQPNNNNLIEVFSFFEEQKIKFKFDLVVKSFDNHFIPKMKDLKIFEKQMDVIIKKYKKMFNDNVRIYSSNILNDLKRIHYGITNDIACGASRYGFFIDIEGRIFPCSSHTSSVELSIGDIYNGIDNESIVKNKFYAQPVDNYKSCNTCWMKYLCSGSCFAEKWLENGNTEEPSEYLCQGYNIYWSSIIKLYIQVYHEIMSGSNVNFIEK